MEQQLSASYERSAHSVGISMWPSGAAAVGTAVQNYSNSGYVGYVPTP